MASSSEITHEFEKLSTTEEKTILLQSSDGDTFEVDESIALQSQTIAHLIEDDCVQNVVPLANVDSEALELVLAYCARHVGEDLLTEEEEKADLKEWDEEFMKSMKEESMVYELILASNYLNVKGLLDLSCQTVADEITACKSVEETREKFGIVNDFTPEEEEEFRKENVWAFE